MALETGSYVNSLVTSNPASTDGLAQADDHLRLIKSTIKNTLPNITGAITGTQAELNILDGYTGTTANLNVLSGTSVTSTELGYVGGVTSAIQTQIDSVSSVPTGVIMLWSGAANAIPTGYALCDGANSTPDLRNTFVLGAGSTYAVNATGGSADAIIPSHSHTASVTDGGHTHKVAKSGEVTSGVVSNVSSTSTIAAETNRGDDICYTMMSGSGTADVGQTSSSTTGISVSNSTEGTSVTNANLPPYFALCYIMKT